VISFWLWEYDLPGQPEVTFYEKESGFSSYLLKKIDEHVEIPGRAYLDVSRRSIRSLEKYSILPTMSFPVVRREALRLFESLPAGEVDFHDAVVHCKDGEIDEFVIVRPKMQFLCTDLNRSNVSWIREGEFYWKWRELHVLPGDCIQGCSIAREALSQKVVVSDRFKNALLAADPKGVSFITAEGSRWGYAKHVR
jgi:hypothetical protein